MNAQDPSIPQRRKSPAQSPEEYGERLLVHDPALSYERIEELSGLVRETVVALEQALVQDGIPVPERSGPAVGRKGAVRRMALGLLRQTDEDGRGLSYIDISARIREAFPDSKASVYSVRWYANDLRSAGESLPPRPHGNGPAKPQHVPG
jgi:hypothetical protein